MCSTATKAANDDAAGSVVYPVSSIRSIGMGSMAVTGVISASETVYHIALDPMSISKGAGGAAAGLRDKVDVISKGSFFSLCKGFTVLHYENDIFILIDFINILQVFYSCYIGIYGNSTLF